MLTREHSFCLVLCVCAFVFPCLLAACVPDPVTDKASGLANLSCFSAAAGDVGTSCDALCAARGAACTAVNVGGNNVAAPALNCNVPSVPFVSLCRCCAVAP